MVSLGCTCGGRRTFGRPMYPNHYHTGHEGGTNGNNMMMMMMMQHGAHVPQHHGMHGGGHAP